MCDKDSCEIPSFRLEPPLTFTITEDEEGEWDYGSWDSPIHFHGKTFEELREVIVTYVKARYGNDTKFWITFETDPRNWHV